MKRKNKRKVDSLETKITRKETSLAESQGTSNFSGSAYNGPGNADHGKITSNKKRR